MLAQTGLAKSSAGVLGIMFNINIDGNSQICIHSMN